jgi:hypothetical protein
MEMKYINYRDKKDKDRLIKKLAELYNKQYDIRLCQLISNLHGVGRQDIFFTYDDELEIIIDNLLEEKK